MIKILYVKNQQEDYHNLSDSLLKYEINTILVKDLLEANKFLKKETINLDIILYNLTKEEISDFKFITTIKKFNMRHPDIPILFAIDPGDIDEMNIDFIINNNYIFKPITIEPLVLKIKNIIIFGSMEYDQTNFYKYLESTLKTNDNFKNNSLEQNNYHLKINSHVPNHEENLSPQKIIKNIFYKLAKSKNLKFNKVNFSVEEKIENLNIVVDTKYFYTALEEIFISLSKYISNISDTPIDIKLTMTNKERIQLMISHKDLSTNIINNLKEISFVNKVFDLHGIKTNLLCENNTNFYIIRIPKYRISYANQAS